MNDSIYFRPAIPLLISLICGILIGSDFAGYEIWAMAATVICAGFCLRQIVRKKNAWFLPILLFVLLGYLSIQPWVSPRLPANHVLQYSDTHRWDITGRIANAPQKINHRTRFHLQTTSLGDDVQIHAVSGTLRVTAVGDVPDLSVGDEVRFNSRIRSPTNFKNPGGFDYKRYLAFKGIWATAYLKGDTLVVIKKYPAGGTLKIMEKARSRFAGLIDGSGYTRVQRVFKALIIGDRTQLLPETRQAFNRAGVGHLLAISGLHIGIVATVAFGFFRWLMARFKPFLWRAWTRKGAAIVTLLPVMCYGMVAGYTPSTQRAVIMVLVFLSTFLFEREQDPLNTLSLAALVILIVDPPSLFSISFQLSFTAVFAIIYGCCWIQKRMATTELPKTEQWYSSFVKKLFSFFLVSLFAICGSLPLVAAYFNQVSLVGLAANFIVVPLVGFVTIPLGLLALFVLPLSTTVAVWCIQAGSAVLTVAWEVVQFFAELPFAAIKIFTPSPLEIGCYYVLCWTLLNLDYRPRFAALWSHRSKRLAPSSVPRDMKTPLPGGDSGLGKFKNIRKRLQLKRIMPSNPAIAVLVLVLLTLAGDTCYWLYQRFGRADLRVTVIDVGHGSAALLEFPKGYTMLIDGGGFTDNAAFDVGAAIVAPLLWKKKIRTVDTLILSHPNSDHLNGLIYIAKFFHVKNVWTNSEARDTLGYQIFMDVVANHKIVLPSFADMPRSLWINGVKLDFLYPPKGYLKRKEKESWRNTNNNSLVVKVSLGTRSFLFPGDIMAAAEEELVGMAGRKLDSTVLIAPHHGSRSSSSTSFLGEVNPEVVVISCGRRSRFKLPHPFILKKYQDNGYAIFRTDLNGAISLSTNGQQLEIKPFFEVSTSNPQRLSRLP
ncbi:MAG: ComEC/Rec2 family competence protein [Desulfobacterales bacterium]|jgi:competence protein ComEC